MSIMAIRITSMMLFIVLAPFIGGLLDGIDRKITARMQGRVGPPILQPFYDVTKLFNKQLLDVYRMQGLMVLTYLFFMRVEQPRGEAFYYIKGNGTKFLDRMRVRTPTFANIPPMVATLKGSKLADVPLLILTIDPCISCTER